MIGKTISHYKIESKLGSGGMGEVYLATDTELDRPVALKFLADSLIRDTDARSRFLVEARSASKINHPNVVSVYAMEGVQGSHFISMEYVRGKTLQSVIAGGPIDIPVACDLIKQIAAGVAAAHELNIVHRDVKPSNVIITESGIAKIMDFGLAQIPGTSLITTPGAVMGTVAYMAPEQIQGLEVDARADVFSLGVVFYELLTGQRPFNGDHGAALMYSVVYDEPPPVRELRPEVGNGIQALVTKALSKSAELRYADAREFVHALKSAGAPVAASEPREPHVDIEPPSVRSLAVLYLRNLGNAEDEYLSYGVTEDLIVDLARVGTLRVAPMRSVLQFKDSTTQLGEVARQLNARLILDGSIHRSDRLIRISAQLVDVDQNRTLWANRWEEPQENLPRIKNDLATGITRALSIDTAIAEPVQPHRDGAQDPQAYKAYLRGKYVFDHMNSASDVDIALGLYRQAVSLEPALVEAYAGIGEVLLHQGKYDPAIRELQAGLAEARQRGRRPDEVAILKLLSRAHDRLGNWQEALDEGHRAVEIARDLGDLAGEADSLGQIISVLRKQSKNDLAMAMFQRVVEINRQLDDHEKILSALFEMGTLYVNMNDHTRARGLFEEALGAAQEQGNQSLIAQGMTLVGAACVREGNYSEGMRYFREGLEIGRRIGDQDRIGECTADIGIIHVIWGEYHEALKYLEAAVEMAHAAGSRRAKAISLISLAHAEGMLGKYDRAITHATEAASIAGDLNLSDISVLAMNCVGDMHLYHGDHERAARQFKDAITFAEKTETRILVDSSLIGLATAFTQALASSASLACAERALKEAAKSNDPSARFISSAYIGAAEVRLHDFESGIEKLYDSYSEAQKNGDFYEELRVQRLLGEALFHNAPTSHDREQGRRILQNALASATAREVPHEIRWINKILSSSE